MKNIKEKINPVKQKIHERGITKDISTGRFGLALFVKYMNIYIQFY